MTVKPTLSIVTLGVADLGRSVAFYSRLGWLPVDQTDTIAFLDLGGVRLALQLCQQRIQVRCEAS